MSPKSRAALATLASLAAAACAGGAAQPASAPAPATAARAHSPYMAADVAFMAGMIHHHGQALDMTALVPARSEDETLRLLAGRIEATQLNEIERMSRWLSARAETVPDPRAYREHGAHGAHMPGMLTPDRMERLAAASGETFERLFLEYMIQHHEGALVIVAELQAAGGGLEAEIYRFASDVDADQRAEIARMQSMLTALQRGS